VKDHADTLQLVQKAASEAQDPQLRALAQKAAPHVQQHLDLAQRIAGQVVGQSR
jgi:predicted outer membrane protein